VAKNRMLKIDIVYVMIFSVSQVLLCQKVLRRIFVLVEEEATVA
jgi:hypothetical protein